MIRKVHLDWADRMQRMPMAPDSDLDRIVARLIKRNVEVIDLSRSFVASPLPCSINLNPDRTDGWLTATEDDLSLLREAVADWYARRFHVRVNPLHEIEIVPNTTVGLCQLALAFVDHGDMVLVPDPGLPVYRSAVILAGGGVIPYHLWERNDFLPSFAVLEEGLAGRVRLMIMSYPHNPSATMADLSVLSQAVAFARKNNILIVFDSTLAHATYGPTRPRGFLDTVGARGVGIEIFALGPNFGLPRSSLAVVVGNRDVVNALTFLVQASGLRPTRDRVHAAVAGLSATEDAKAQRLQRLDVSRQILLEAFIELGGAPRSSPTVPFLWASIPATLGSEAFCRRLLRRAGIRLRPGTVFGERGEGFVRAAIPEDEETARRVADRLRRHAHLYQRRLPRSGPLRRRRASRSNGSGEKE